ncbi:AAA family ATPase [Chryseobacterium sp. A321]
MITKIVIDNFKCFDSIKVELRNLNILCGTNSSGKSSVIQALLLIDNCMSEEASLNSKWLNLGYFDEIRNFIVRRDTVKIGIEQENITYDLCINESSINPNNNGEYNKINYISANRIGPKDFYHKITSKKNFIGENAEFLIDYLYQNSSNTINPNLVFDQQSNTLDYHVNYWLKKILNVTINLDNITSGNIITANYSYRDNKHVRPYHIGAGISYIVGILILCLNADNNETIVIENPEIHLHPKAQSELASFLCFVAKAGIQLIVETHSDHIFNGVRKSIHRKEIQNDLVKIHFFELDENNISHNHLIKLNNDGRILNLKDGLFDQFDNDLDELLDLV